MNKRLLLLSLPIFLSLSILFLTTSPTFAENDSTDPIYNPETNKYYQFVQDIGISWNDAEINAKELSHGVFTGQLAVITTQDENDFVTNLLPDESSAWIGLKASDEGFKWINEETFDYSNWSSYQPTNGNYEDYVELFEYNGKWNDTVNGNHDVIGYIVEYTPPQNSDIDPEYYNGHYYIYINNNTWGIPNDPPITWEYANEQAESLWWNGMQGHLVTITDDDENNFVSGLLVYGEYTMIGASDIEVEGEPMWVTGEPFDYARWTPNQPDGYRNSQYANNLFIGNDGIFFYWSNDETSVRSNFGYMVEFSP